MSPRTQRQFPHGSPYRTANAAWKAQWGNTLAWSTVFAVAVHAAVFVFWPGWEISDALADAEIDLLGTAWIALYAPPASIASGGAGGVPPLLALIQEPDSLPNELDAGLSDGETALALAGGSTGLRDRLAGRGGPVPSIVQFNSPFGPPGIGDDGADTREELEVTENADDPVAEDLALLLETSPLDLSRLAAVRPQIVLPGTSAWILIRNPAEVDRFMNARAYEEEDPEASGLVDVAVWIDEWGSVEWAEISRSSGLQELDEIALALFNEVASFRPARDQGVRVSMSVIFSVPFPW